LFAVAAAYSLSALTEVGTSAATGLAEAGFSSLASMFLLTA